MSTSFLSPQHEDFLLALQVNEDEYKKVRISTSISHVYLNPCCDAHVLKQLVVCASCDQTVTLAPVSREYKKT